MFAFLRPHISAPVVALVSDTTQWFFPVGTLSVDVPRFVFRTFYSGNAFAPDEYVCSVRLRQSTVMRRVTLCRKLDKSKIKKYKRDLECLGGG